MKGVRAILACLLCAVWLCCLAGCGRHKPDARNYTRFSKWGLSFEYPEQWQELPADHVERAREKMLQKNQYWRLQEFAAIRVPDAEAGILVGKLTAFKVMKPSEFVEVTKRFCEDAKRAGDITKINYVKETTIAGLPAVEHDLEHSGGVRDVTHIVMVGKAVYSVSLVVQEPEKLSDYAAEFQHIASSITIVGQPVPARKAPPQK